MELYNANPQRDKIEKLTISIKEAAQMLGISYNVMLTLVHRKDFPKILAGQRRILIPKEAFMRWVNEQACQNK